jgi:hypothetical protein
LETKKKRLSNKNLDVTSLNASRDSKNKEGKNFTDALTFNSAFCYHITSGGGLKTQSLIFPCHFYANLFNYKKRRFDL